MVGVQDFEPLRMYSLVQDFEPLRPHLPAHQPRQELITETGESLSLEVIIEYLSINRFY